MQQTKFIRNKAYYKNRINFIFPRVNWLNKSVLDLGCGEGFIIPKLRSIVHSYFGIDLFNSNSEQDILQGDIFDPLIYNKLKYDICICLGVLDHLSLADKLNCLSLCKQRSNELLILSQRNPNIFFNPFFLGKKSVKMIDLETTFIKNRMEKMYLLKFPFFQYLFQLSSFRFLQRYLATEIIYFIHM